MPEEIRQRATAYKLRIGDLLRGKPIIENERFNFLELDNKQVIRVNVVANVVDKYQIEGTNNPNEQDEAIRKKKYLALTIDDASGQIRIKSFGEDVGKFSEIT